MNIKLANITDSKKFMITINIVIIFNAILIGIETFHKSALIHNIQSTILAIFTLEIVFRFAVRTSFKDYITNGWNLFDLFIVGISYIPDSMLEHSEALSVFRVIRVFRVLRMVETLPELRTIVTVLLKSLKSLGYTFALLNIFMYMFAIMGVILFRGGSVAVNGPNSPDPYGNITEAYFTLFRIMTGDGWSTVRYNLLGDQVHGSADWMITGYHVFWVGISSFLLVNLVVGAVVNNYERVMEEEKQSDEEEIQDEMAMLNYKMDKMSRQLEILVNDKIADEKT